jgi:hypothetical protein
LDVVNGPPATGAVVFTDPVWPENRAFPPAAGLSAGEFITLKPFPDYFPLGNTIEQG